MRVIVTRPAHDAQRWVMDLLAVGLEAAALPLINIGPLDDRSAMISAWQRLGDYVGVMFVSANVQPGRIDMPEPQARQFDSEALWQVVAPQVHRGERVLIVRGGDNASVGAGSPGVGRDWLARRLVDRGAAVDFVVAYQRMAPDFSAHESSLARAAAADGSVWLFSSSQAIANLTALLPSQRWSSARALVTHPRIAQAATAAGFGVVQESTPLFSEVVVSLQRMAQVAR